MTGPLGGVMPEGRLRSPDLRITPKERAMPSALLVKASTTSCIAGGQSHLAVESAVFVLALDAIHLICGRNDILLGKPLMSL
jgi:hypothetical protein